MKTRRFLTYLGRSRACLWWLGLTAACHAGPSCGSHGGESAHTSVQDASAGDAGRSDAATESENEPVEPLKLAMPQGTLPMLSCEDAQNIVAQVLETLPYEAKETNLRELPATTLTWLDVYGFWTAPGFPNRPAFVQALPALATSIHGGDPLACAPSTPLADGLVLWLSVLEARYQEGAKSVQPTHITQVPSAAASSLPELIGKRLETFLWVSERPSNDASTSSAHHPPRELPLGENELREARAVAFDLGRDSARIGALAPELAAAVARTHQRMFPTQTSAEWQDAVTAATMRAYVPLLDAHGEWVPREEEAILYDIDLDDVAPARLWKSASPTLVGARIEEGATAPLRDGDIVLEVATVSLAGFPSEQLQQISHAVFTDTTSAPVAVWRDGKRVVLTVSPAPGPVADVDEAALVAEEIALQEGTLLQLKVTDVHDALGKDFGAYLKAHAGGSHYVGLVLDLRENGGGSMDGAVAWLAHVLPSLPMFPMRDREGTLEADITPSVPDDELYRGPLAVLVNGHTASAAEMIAGAVLAYRRGEIVGTQTFGKGCIQQFLTDPRGVGVLKATTMLYALPDGNPVQRTGIVPTLIFPFVTDDHERENSMHHAPPTFRTHDVRGSYVPGPAFPHSLTALGPCKDKTFCAALTRIAQHATRPHAP